jgi:F5/8 type C domain/PASTA domain
MGRAATLLVVLLLAASVTEAATATAPANDDFAASATLTGDSGVVEGSNNDATVEAAEPEHWSAAGGRSVWYRWVAPSGGPVTFDTCSASFDNVLAVYTGSALAALSRVGVSDDACGTGSRVSFAASAGSEYRIAVDGYDAAAGTFSLAWRRAPAPPVVVEWPIVSGTRIDGSTLAVSAGRWSGAEPITLAYRWRRCHTGCGDISGATGPAYTLTPADVGHSLVAEVTASNAGGATSAQAWAGLVSAAPPRLDTAPLIQGTPRAGRAAFGTHVGWAGTPPVTLAYQWQACRSGESEFADVALRRPVRASLQFPANPATMAVDGDFASWWGAGGFAPQWLEVDLGVPTPVAELRLATSQTPPGLTVHRVYGRLAGGDERLLHEFAGTTADGAWLRQGLVPEVQAQFIRVETVLSPSWVSWREVEVLSRCRDLPGMTGNTYVPRVADIGATLRFVVRATNAGAKSAHVSLESPPVRGCIVPRLTGATVRAARASLRGRGCRLGRVVYAFSSRPVGRIVRQAPPPAARRPFESPVNIVVSRGRR